VLSRKNRFLWLVLLLLVPAATAPAQEAATGVPTDGDSPAMADASPAPAAPVAPPAASPEASEDVPGVAYEIVDISFSVTGASRPGPLLIATGLSVGDDVDSEDALDALLFRARQDLLNRRIFDEVTVEWRILDDEEEPRQVAVTFIIEDGWTLLPIPFYRYDSNSGHNPFVVLYWDNVLGTLTDFGMSAGYYSRNWHTPFAWDVRLDWRRVRMLGREWTFSFDQEFDTEELATPLGDVQFSYTGFSSRFSVSTSFFLLPWLTYSITPNVGFEYGYKTVVNEIGESLPADRAAAGFSHRVGTGRIDWIGNLRRGWGASLSNSISYDPEQRDLRADLGASYAHHWLPFPRIGPAVRGQINHDLNGDRLSRGGVVRGVPNNRIFGQTLLSGNGQVSILAIDWQRVIDIQLVPFVDAAVARKEDASLSWDDMAVGFGADLVLFPDFIRGFEARLSLGVDARDVFFGDGGSPAVEFSITESLQF
jgi:hypothetical protein